MSSDDAIRATNDDAAACKRFAIQQGYWKDPYLQYFVRSAERKQPDINRGYYVRTQSVKILLKNFLKVMHIQQILAQLQLQLYSFITCTPTPRCTTLHVYTCTVPLPLPLAVLRPRFTHPISDRLWESPGIAVNIVIFSYTGSYYYYDREYIQYT